MTVLKKLFHFFWDREFFRFLLSAGINTVVGYGVTLFFSYVLHLADPIPTLLNYAVCFPLAYTVQARIAFRSPWSVKRMFGYLASSVPNYLLQLGFVMLFLKVFHFPEYLAYAFGYVLPVPIMFFVIRFIVKPKNKK